MKQLLLIAFLIYAGTTNAQKKRPESLAYPLKYKKAIHFNPFGLAHLDNTILVGAEHRKNEKEGIVLEAGYIFYSSFLFIDEGSMKNSGLLIRPSYRFYLGKRNNYYFQPQVFYKMVTHKITGWIGKDCSNNVPVYEEIDEIKFRRHVFGLNAIYGRIIPLGRKGSSFVDFYMGIGVRHNKETTIGDERNCFNPWEGFDRFVDPGTKFLPSLPMGVKLIFVVE